MSGQVDAVAPDVLDRTFEAPAPNRKWIAAFTYVWTAEGWLYVAAVGHPFQSLITSIACPRDRAVSYALARKNFGGVKTDLKCRLLDKHFEPIGGLYAAGEVAGMAGGHINGGAGLEGTMLGPSIFSGRVAGGWAAQAAGHGGGFVGKPNRG